MKMAANNMDETSMDGLFKFLKNARIPINEEGNILTEEQQWAKLALVKEILDEVWGQMNTSYMM